jgi:aspartate kinase
VTLHVRSSFTEELGTFISHQPEGDNVEEPIISGVAGDTSEAKITVVGVPDIPGKAAEIFTIVAGAGANIDMIVQNVSLHETGRTDISFTLPREDGQRAMQALGAAQKESGFGDLIFDDGIGRLSVVGAGMRTNAGVSAQLFTALSGAGINIEMISTSEIRISVIMRADILADAVRAVHHAFGLDGDVDATVYAGTGR